MENRTFYARVMAPGPLRTAEELRAQVRADFSLTIGTKQLKSYG